MKMIIGNLFCKRNFRLAMRPSSMADNLFAAFAFSGAPRQPSPGGGAHTSKAVSKRKGGENNASNLHVGAASASHVAVLASCTGRVKVNHENATHDFGSEMSSTEGGGNSRNAPAIQNFESHHPFFVSKIEKAKEEVWEEPKALTQGMCAIQVKEEETEQTVESSLAVKKKKRHSLGYGGTEEELGFEIEDFGGGGGDLSCLSADSKTLELKNVKMRKKQNLKGRKHSSAEVRFPPPKWEEAIQSIRTMRTSRDAPVDLLGPAQLVDPNADSETQKFHVLVAAMISSQTRDAVTAAAVKRLHAMPGGLTIKHISGSDISMEMLAELLKPVGFYRVKAKQLKSMAEILLKPPYSGRVPRALDELLKLPGVGPKVGLLVLWAGFKMGEVGFIVDTNIRRVCCRLGWAPEGSSAEQVRQELESWLAKDLWAEVSYLLVGFGQQICKPIGPNCKGCQLQDFCPSAFKAKFFSALEEESDWVYLHGAGYGESPFHFEGTGEILSEDSEEILLIPLCEEWKRFVTLVVEIVHNHRLQQTSVTEYL